jgi:uncharacterized protein YkwD
MRSGLVAVVTAAAALAAETAGPLRASPRVEREMVDLVNRERRAHGLPALAPDAGLAAVARDHSLDMARSGFFAHESPTTGRPQDRIFRAGLASSATGENIAQAANLEEAHRNLMNSPRHRANILSTLFDRIGIGIVARGRTLLVTQNFRKAIGAVDPEGAAREILAGLNAGRRRRRLADLVVRDDLDAIAREVASAQNREQRLLPRMPGTLLTERGVPYRRFFSYVFLDRSIGPASAIREASHETLDGAGIGVAVNRTQEKGLGMLWMVVLLAQAR